MTNSLFPAFPLSKFAGKRASKIRSREISRPAHNGEMIKNLTSYLND